MKKLILIALALVTIQVSAQNKKQGERRGDPMERGQRMGDFTPEEMAQLQTKKTTLLLDLTVSQQKEVEKLHLENAKERQAFRETRQAKRKDGNGKNSSKEERLKMANQRLDRQLEMQKKMKKILNDEQFEKWEMIQAQGQGKSPKKNKGIRKQRS